MHTHRSDEPAPSKLLSYDCPHIRLGQHYEDRKDHDGAEWAYREAVRLCPQNAAAHSTLGRLLQDVRKDYDGAEQAYREAVRLDPQNAAAHGSLGARLQDVREDREGGAQA